MLYAILFTLLAPYAHANDAGVATIKASQIKMREYKLDQGREVELRRINDPYFKIMIEGEQADRLQKILPAVRSVLTNMYPDLAKEYNETFKSLGIYNNNVKSDGRVLVSSKVLSISCDDGELKYPADGGKPKIVKRGQSNCVIAINAVPEDQIGDYLGDTGAFDPAEVCR